MGLKNNDLFIDGPLGYLATKLDGVDFSGTVSRVGPRFIEISGVEYFNYIGRRVEARRGDGIISLEEGFGVKDKIDISCVGDGILDEVGNIFVGTRGSKNGSLISYCRPFGEDNYFINLGHLNREVLSFVPGNPMGISDIYNLEFSKQYLDAVAKYFKSFRVD